MDSDDTPRWADLLRPEELEAIQKAEAQVRAAEREVQEAEQRLTDAEKAAWLCKVRTCRTVRRREISVPLRGDKGPPGEVEHIGAEVVRATPEALWVAGGLIGPTWKLEPRGDRWDAPMGPEGTGCRRVFLTTLAAEKARDEWLSRARGRPAECVWTFLCTSPYGGDVYQDQHGARLMRQGIAFGWVLRLQWLPEAIALETDSLEVAKARGGWTQEQWSAWMKERTKGPDA